MFAAAQAAAAQNGQRSCHNNPDQPHCAHLDRCLNNPPGIDKHCSDAYLREMADFHHDVAAYEAQQEIKRGQADVKKSSSHSAAQGWETYVSHHPRNGQPVVMGRPIKSRSSEPRRAGGGKR